ncbi:hypothetical protein K144312032_14460 [Clostridium tetani]|uniref:hypothetical protein n=1 Tax=Clostridium tetani TaxID=1513 RepID=UPI0029533046|nr:hypothetical protein [Clostridium tetani]BDR67218.1 hypothetical protein K144312032_14460 [Clostridium tetani]
MKKIGAYLNYKELQIVKHALQTQIINKKWNVSICEEYGHLEFKKKLEKDIIEEEQLLESITSLVNELKRKWEI